MPMSNIMAFRLGRPDLVQGSLAVSGDFSQQMNDTPSGMTVSADLTTGRIAMSLLIIALGAIAISYVATRARQY